MPYSEKLPEWLNPGQEPPSTRKNSGWSPQDRPPAEWMNYHQNRTYKVLKELQENATHNDVFKEAESRTLATPEKFQAKRDGITNDTPAFKEMLLLARGRQIFLGEGTYLLKIEDIQRFFALSATNLTVITGVKGKTVIKLDLGAEQVKDDKSGILSVANVELDGIIFDGGFDPSVSKANLSAMVQVGSNSVVRNCGFKNSRGSNLLIIGQNISVHDNKFEKFGDHAVYIQAEVGSATTQNINIYDNEAIEDDTYQNGTSGGKVRGVFKVRDNVKNVHFHGNNIQGDQCILISGKASAEDGIPKSIFIHHNPLKPTYAGVHLETSLTVDNGFRIKYDCVYVNHNEIDLQTNAAAVVLQNSTISFEVNTVKDDTGTGTAINEFGLGDMGQSIIKGNTFKGMKIGLFKMGSATIIQDNIFIGIKTVAVYSNYGDKVTKNHFFSCAEGIRMTGAHTTSTALYDDNYFYNCTVAVLQKSDATGYYFTNNKFFGNTQSLVLENPIAFRAEKPFGNMVYSGAPLPESANGSPVVHSPFQFISRSSLPAPSYVFADTIIKVSGSAGVSDKFYILIKKDDDTYGWGQLPLTLV
ncbi:hypothetical protein ASG61_22965 [Bacillus sp. Leaf75]|nr:hypothetical protein ASG61_22965 [Bacillus sp. Leaf75]